MCTGLLALTQSNPQIVNSLWDALLGGFILFMLATLLFLSGKIREAMYVTFVRWVKRHSKLGAPTAAGQLEISRLLQALRERFNPLRVCVYQFHNGDNFMLSNHAWKLSCTHEILHPETVSRVSENQGFPASALIEMVEPMFNPKSDVTGVEELGTGTRGNRLLHYEFCKLPMCVTQALANAQGIRHAFITTVLDTRHRDAVIGFVTLQFQELPDGTTEAVKAGLTDLCDVAEKVGFYLTTDFKTFSPKEKPWWYRFFPD